MKLVIIFGDSAVGKMTVGQELAKKTGLRLFHNHVSIEPVIEVFGYYDAKTILRVRDVIFEEFAASKLDGMITTYMWDFDSKDDWDYTAHVAQIFEKQGAQVYYVELDAPLEVRLERNVTENRLVNKASKRDIEVSNERVIRASTKYRCTSREGELPFSNYLRILNADVSAQRAADMIIERFGLLGGTSEDSDCRGR